MNPLQKEYDIFPSIEQQAHITAKDYQSIYQQSLESPEQFWSEQAERYLTWIEPWQEVSQVDYHQADIRWFAGGKLNVCYNCVDRHLPTRANQTAIIWQGDEPGNVQHITYLELHHKVCQFANALKTKGVEKGDRVCIYMPMIPETMVAMLACARIGAIHSVVFGGFSPESLAARIQDSDCKVVVTANEGVRGGKTIPLKDNTDQALLQCPNVESVFVVQVTEQTPNQWQQDRDIWWHEFVEKQALECPVEVNDAEDPLFILYTSGSTGKPKGVMHTSAGYLLYAAFTHKMVFDYKEGEVFWCTADAGWITGHSYILYGPLANGATTLVFEGVPTYPDASRFWQIVDQHQVNIFYTAPTAIRALMSLGDDPVKKHDRSSLRILGTVGEPINPEAWHWYYDVVGEQRCPIVDTWWQTETGGMLITPMPGATSLKPGSATRPFFGVEPVLLDEKGNELEGAAEGYLAMKRSWPGQMRTVYGDHDRFKQTYFSQYPGYYFTGDGAKRDEDGYYWITGRVDDVLNVSGHRIGTAEVESALVLHPAIAEAAVVGQGHDIKGEAIVAFVSPMTGVEKSDALLIELQDFVAEKIGKIARPEQIVWSPALPKTRSGKIMRRIIRKLVNGQADELGDTSTLADPSVVNHLINALND
ncbi:acetate--CoA ligase [Algicola sagamiensis]|uniref:acetate--CoA ligase n=1 Tax=Algicola sagamiensis TaxID=163869 RepID=UPI00037D7881|nr:acetate--CoA ligase [Algicola sagamiensis]